MKSGKVNIEFYGKSNIDPRTGNVIDPNQPADLSNSKASAAPASKKK
ncbi:MAG: hypothetical protein HC902_14835 [Calothrix sp. SM1_5_4]|nr:hypothetical protein [Calothrix sp. SM1_5_4]